MLKAISYIVEISTPFIKYAVALPTTYPNITNPSQILTFSSFATPKIVPIHSKFAKKIPPELITDK